MKAQKSSTWLEYLSPLIIENWPIPKRNQWSMHSDRVVLTFYLKMLFQPFTYLAVLFTFIYGYFDRLSGGPMICDYLMRERKSWWNDRKTSSNFSTEPCCKYRTDLSLSCINNHATWIIQNSEPIFLLWIKCKKFSKLLTLGKNNRLNVICIWSAAKQLWS